MLSAVLSQLPHAAGLTDMRAPGLPIAFCNQAMVDLTGYPRGEIEGRNCRFLQGKRTEAAGVRAMVSGIAGAKAVSLRITNYRKDEAVFKNRLSLLPVHNSEGVYCFNVGLLADDARWAAEGAAMETLRPLLAPQPSVDIGAAEEKGKPSPDGTNKDEDLARALDDELNRGGRREE